MRESVRAGWSSAGSNDRQHAKANAISGQYGNGADGERIGERGEVVQYQRGLHLWPVCNAAQEYDARPGMPADRK